MKKLILLFVFLVCLVWANAQISFSKSVDFTSENLNSSSIGIDIQDDTILSFDSKNGNLTLRFYKSDSLLTKKEFPLKKYFNKSNCEFEPMCLFQNNLLGILCGDELLVARLNSMQELQKIELKKLSSSFDFFKKSTGKFYCGSYFSLDRNLKKMEVVVYDIRFKKITTNYFTLDFPLATTVHPNSYFDPLYSSENRFLVSDALHYSIKIYDSTRLIDSIELEDANLFPKISDIDSIAYKRMQSNHLSLTDVTKFNSKMREKCSHIWSVFYLNSNSILVRISIPKGNHFEMFDHLWEKKDSKWILTQVKEINPYVQKSKNLWPYYSLYNKLIKINSGLCLVHFAEEQLNMENFQTDIYFNHQTQSDKLHSRLWYFQVD